MVNTQLLDEYIDKSGLKIYRICEILGISRQAFRKKRKGLVPFKAAEIYVLCEILHITDDRDAIFIPKNVK